MKIVFRTDASLEIGTGHVMRCLTLANALRERGADCRFVCREHPGHLIESIRESGFEVCALPLQADAAQAEGQSGRDLPAHAEWVGAGWKDDVEAVSSEIGEQKVDWLIVDHYGLDARWESALRPYCRKLMVIDDLADRQHDCDMLLDQNLVADMAHRYDDKLPAHCHRMLGPDYALMQPQYAQLHSCTAPRQGSAERLFVYFGGADTNNLAGLTITAFVSLNRNDIAVSVVINPNGPHVHSVRKQVKGRQQIVLHTDLPSLAPLMAESDLAIGGGGASSIERICMGLPSLVVTLAENQIPTVRYQNDQGLVRWVGHKDTVTEASLVKAMEETIDSNSLMEWSARCLARVDGRGVSRVCSSL